MALIDAMQSLLDCSRNQLDPPVASGYLTTGGLLTTWDNCCEGQTWVRLASQEAIAAPKMGMRPQAPCRRSWLVTLGVGALRCAATMNDQGEAPPPEAVTANARQTVVDKDALIEAVQCCLPSTAGVQSFELTRWDALGPDGGCVGGEWTLTMVVQTIDCEDDAQPP